MSFYIYFIHYHEYETKRVPHKRKLTDMHFQNHCILHFCSGDKSNM